MDEKERLKLELERGSLLFHFWDREIRDRSYRQLSWTIALVAFFLGLIQIILNWGNVSEKKMASIVLLTVVFITLVIRDNYIYSKFQKKREKEMKVQANKMDYLYKKFLRENFRLCKN